MSEKPPASLGCLLLYVRLESVGLSTLLYGPSLENASLLCVAAVSSEQSSY